jgi:hypothetical protein
MKDGLKLCLCSTMVPLASATGYATIGGSVSFAGLFVWWLLRMEARESAAEQAEEEAALEGDGDRASQP